VSRRGVLLTTRAGIGAALLAVAASAWAPAASAQGVDPRAILADPAFANTY